MPEQPASVPKNGAKRPNGQQKQDGKESKNPEAKTSRKSDNEYSSGYDFLILNSPMEDRVFPKVMSCISQRKVRNKSLVLALVTYGGSADSAYRIGRYLQSIYEKITVFIPSACKSAGTLLAISGDILVMSPVGELGPLDVQLRRKDEIFGRRSGLNTRAAINDLQTHTFELFEDFMLGIISHSNGNISFKIAADVSAKTTAELMGKIYEQINPDSLGQDFRDLSVATKYCERLNKRGKNIKSDGIKRLVHEYPSHDFVIDIEEAKEIFTQVNLPSVFLYDFMIKNLQELIDPVSSVRDAIVKMVEAAEILTEEENDDAQSADISDGANVSEAGNQNGAGAASQ